MDRGWHEMHVLGQRAPLAERVAWHVEHADACGCRPMPASVRTELARRDAAGATVGEVSVDDPHPRGDRT